MNDINKNRICPKTLSGKHSWRTTESKAMFDSSPFSAPISFHNVYIKYPVCKYCGMVDDTKELAEGEEVENETK